MSSNQSLSQQERQECLAKALEEAAALNPFAEITDPVAWQREQRQDRPLPGRSGSKEHEDKGKM
ncbi:hypothetical protein [Synechococcus sp. PCC 6312]|uniref:hypothetical protein n=1 Tax=Synechococcus sp. (strain ATCC 27167 / PCC 6312) TaxID=195253 RepID=UPI00029F34E0|nr:hypothetical protein [Synechococcus sp. PCC 6312]AFY60248.1 hypothetical protein Syn6312_1054 [Synechococcus sp. PCC 6312]